MTLSSRADQRTQMNMDFLRSASASCGAADRLSVLCLQCGFFVRRREWRKAALHQGRIMGKDEQQQYTDADGFLVQDVTSSRNRKSPKSWVTSWAETR